MSRERSDNMVTIQEVAKEAKVSVATVSRYLNNPEIVATKTRERVEASIKKLNYAPSMLGRNLRKLESKLLIVLIPGISNPFYTEIIDGIEDTAIEQGYNILLCQTDSDPKREETYFNLIKNQLAAGIITMDPTVDREKISGLARQFPLVQCSEYDESGEISFVSIDNKAAAYEGTKYLIEQGHTKIGMVNSDEKFLYARERQAGFSKAMAEAGIEVEEKWIYAADNLEFDSGRYALRTLKEQGELPTAVFAVSDILAIGFMNEAQQQGLKIPESISVLGFDNVSFAKMFNPRLTTIGQPMYEMGEQAATMLINKINGEAVESTILDHKLIVRESTRRK